MKTLKPNQNGQVTLPADFCKKLGIDQNTELLVTLSEDGSIHLKPVVTMEAVPVPQLHRDENLTMTNEEIERYLEESQPGCQAGH